MGLSEVIFPGAIASLIGLPPHRHRRTVRVMGLRELASGAAVLSRPGASGPLWIRVAGDALDLALLTRTSRVHGARRGRTAFAVAAVLGVAVTDVVVASRLRASPSQPRDGVIDAAAAITIARPIAEVFDFWQHYENFPQFMRNLTSVEVLGHGRSRWRIEGPAGLPVEWEAEIVSHQDNHMISWRSLPGSAIENHGAVRFEPAPAGRGTEVHAEIGYHPPAGELGHAAAWLFGRSPRQQMREGLRRVKQLLELGEIPLSDAPALSRAARPLDPPGQLVEMVGSGS